MAYAVMVKFYDEDTGDAEDVNLVGPFHSQDRADEVAESIRRRLAKSYDVASEATSGLMSLTVQVKRFEKPKNIVAEAREFFLGYGGSNE